MDIDLSSASILDVVVDLPTLRTRSEPIGAPDDAVRTLAADMLATMYDAGGIGLAAVQVARPVRMLVFDVTPSERRANGVRAPEVMIDPEIEWSKKLRIEMEEGCLSIPGRRMQVSRPSDIRVRYTQIDGTVRVRDLGGMHARVVQHEMDHLDGVLITDRAA